MYAHIEACRNSGHSQRVYCEQAGLAITTFQYWAKKYRAEFSESEAADLTPGFIPIEVRSDPEEDHSGISNQLHFLFPNGIRVMCSERVQPEVLRTLLNP